MRGCAVGSTEVVKVGRQGEGELRGLPWPETKGQEREAATARRGGGGGNQYLDKPCKLERGNVGIGLARTFSSHKFSLAA